MTAMVVPDKRGGSVQSRFGDSIDVRHQFALESHRQTAAPTVLIEARFTNKKVLLLASSSPY